MFLSITIVKVSIKLSNSERYISMFPSRSTCVLPFMLKSTIYIWVWSEMKIKFYFFFNSGQDHFCLKTKGPFVCGSVSEFSTVLPWFGSLFFQIPLYCFNNCPFICFNILSCKSSNLVLLQYCLGYSWLLTFPYTF